MSGASPSAAKRCASAARTASSTNAACSKCWSPASSARRGSRVASRRRCAPSSTSSTSPTKRTGAAAASADVSHASAARASSPVPAAAALWNVASAVSKSGAASLYRPSELSAPPSALRTVATCCCSPAVLSGAPLRARRSFSTASEYRPSAAAFRPSSCARIAGPLTRNESHRDDAGQRQRRSSRWCGGIRAAVSRLSARGERALLAFGPRYICFCWMCRFMVRISRISFFSHNQRRLRA